MFKKEYNRKVSIKPNDMVKLRKVEPKLMGNVVEILDNNTALVMWKDGILVEHYVDELRIIRLDEIAGPWMGF